MERHEQLYRLYGEFDTETLREYQRFVDLFPPVDSRVALEHWQDASDQLEDRKDEIRGEFAAGETFADVAAHADRDQAFTALDLYAKYGRAVDALVLDVDETLRSAGSTDNEIPRETLHVLRLFYESDVPVVICTGQTLENVKGFMIQGLGNELVHSGRLSVVYEAGTGVFTPGHGSDTKRLLYKSLDDGVRTVFEQVRSRVLSDAPEEVRRCCHLQGNEFNVTLKPNFEAGSDAAADVIDAGLVWLLDLLGEAVAAVAGCDPDATVAAARAHYAAADPELRDVLEREGERFDADSDPAPAATELFDRIDVAYYHADAAEIGSLELDKPRGVAAALETLGIDDPFVAVMGDSKSDLRVMEWVAERDAGIAAAPEHASRDVLDHVLSTDELVFDRGEAEQVLRIVYALNRLGAIDPE